MSTKSALLELLQAHENEYLSGQYLAETLGITRNSIWKASMKLKAAGYRIDAVQGLGYRLTSGQDLIDGDVIQGALGDHFNVHAFERLGSTNNYAKTLPLSDKIELIVADEQTAGRGRMGRSFVSPKGCGIYMSFCFAPNFVVSDGLLITALSSVAIAKAIEKIAGANVRIKWVNDLYKQGKKVCGILTEAETSFESGKISRLTVGIGLNCFETKLPDDIAEIATFLGTEKKQYTRSALIIAIAQEFEALLKAFEDKQKNLTPLLTEYRRRSYTLAKEIYIFNPALSDYIGRPENRRHDGIRARALDITESGGLLIEFLESHHAHEYLELTTGEITIRVVD